MRSLFLDSCHSRSRRLLSDLCSILLSGFGCAHRTCGGHFHFRGTLRNFAAITTNMAVVQGVQTLSSSSRKREAVRAFLDELMKQKNYHVGPLYFFVSYSAFWCLCVCPHASAAPARTLTSLPWPLPLLLWRGVAPTPCTTLHWNRV